MRIPVLASALLALAALFPAVPALRAQDTVAAATATPAIAPKKTAVSLLADVAAVAPGGAFRLALVIDHASHKHTYWAHPGEAGTVTSADWKQTSGATLAPIRFPAPTLLKQSGILAFVLEGRSVLLIDGRAPADAKPGATLKLESAVSWLECDATTCLPGDATLSLDLPVAARTESANADLFAAAESAMPASPPAAATLARGDKPGLASLDIPAAALAGRDTAGARFFPLNNGLADSEAHPSSFALAAPGKLPDGALRFTLADAALALKTGKLDGVLTFASGRPLAVAASLANAAADTAAPLPPNAAPGGSPNAAATLPAALLLAFIGGVILNVMPCVFPVLGLKIYGFVQKAGGRPGEALRHGLAFAGGIVVSFWILAGALLALRGAAAGLVGGNAVGWGFLQQMPAFNIVIALLFLVMALGMVGVFEFGTGVQNAAGAVREREGPAGSFLSGALATLVATPCSGPGMAPAIGYALNASPGDAFLVFTAMALGLAAPFAILSASPRLLSLLPRPGAWMESFKQGMSFLLFGSFAYFVWVLAGQLEEQAMLVALIAFTAVACACWIHGRWNTPERDTRVRILARVIAAAVLLASGIAFAKSLPERADSPASAGKTAAIAWTPWSPDAQAAALAAGKTVYVDFTARWCLTCQANKHVYKDDAVIRAFAEKGVVALRADWSNRNALITEELKKYGRASIPFNIVLRRDAAPVELPSLLTADAVTSSLATK